MKRRNSSNDNGDDSSYRCGFDEATQERLRDYSDRKDQSVCETVRESVHHFLKSREREDDEEED